MRWSYLCVFGFVLIGSLGLWSLQKPQEPAAVMADKTSWPELVGQPAEDAKRAILRDRPNLNVQIVPEDAMVTMDWREDRVRIFVDKNNKVAKEPRTG